MKTGFLVFAFVFLGLMSVGAQEIDNAVLSISIDGRDFNLLSATTPAAKAKGLGGRVLMPKDGMIFFFDRPQQLIFWMKDMLFAIDIVWISGDKVIGFEQNAAPQSGVRDEDLKKYYSPHFGDTVIELNAGDVKKFNIKVGSKITIRR